MSSNSYNYQLGNDNDYEGMPKKRFSWLGLLSKIRNFCFLILLVIVVFTVWPSLHNESYMRFRLILGLIFNKVIFSLVVSSFIEGFQLQPIARSIELLVLVVCVWKLIFRGEDPCFSQNQIDCHAQPCIILALSDSFLRAEYHNTADLE